MKNFFLILCFATLLTSCAKPHEQIVNIPEPLEEIQTDATKTNSDGSLWPGEQHSLYADLKGRATGDIVTVTISEKASASKEASTDSDRSSSLSAAIPNFLGIENSTTLAQNPNIDLSTLLKAEFANTFAGSGKTVRKEDLVASLTTQVIQVYPNGNLKIRGGKEVRVNNETQVIYLTGIIRPVDIMANNTIDSKNVLNARISYTGKGAISDKQNPGWMTRVIDNVWPF
ncbi:MAG: flagellar basal body L-ring protein FlgH [Desulfocapsaceae bacterium]|nr:flagellar basal body L-ring protein FlgH [Desulfocapsaceae bacterium]